MVPGPDDEFANFLEFGDLQLELSPFETLGHDGGNTQEEVGATMDTIMDNAPSIADFGIDHILQQPGQSMADPLTNRYSGSTDQLLNMQTSGEQVGQNHHLQANLKQQRHYAVNMVPPTPNSIEMHGGVSGYYQAPMHQQAHSYEHYPPSRRDQMVFTPLVSPAVTPLDSHFQYPEPPLLGDNFSPLTSPAIEARAHAAHSSAFETMRNSDTSETTSPIDLSASLPASGSVPAKKTRRKTLPTQKNPARSVKQSPAMKPQSRKKQTTSTTIPQREVSGIIEEASKKKASKAGAPRSSANLPLPCTHDSSEAESISPEPLSEILMPPPATPKSSTAGQSPSLVARNLTSKSAPTTTMPEEPATPASLMRIRKGTGSAVAKRQGSSGLKEQASLAEMDSAEAMEDIALPEPAKTSKPALTPINTAEANDEQATPTLSGQKTPKCGTTSAPLTATSSVFPSPQLSALVSPGGTKSSNSAQPKNNLRERKKRTSSSSVQVSPALRPRISPSIKPLLPEGAASVSPETSALLLASKSNYQNILEGTHLPGVSYPETLSTNLTSKRTSHKLAEQGRRNRINTALQEIASLLPPSTPNLNGNNGKSPSANGKDEPAVRAGDAMLTGTAAQQSNSKASTVELAIEYIKNLQGELNDVKGRLEVAEQELKKRPADGDG